MKAMYTCPVCGYDRLRRPADDYLICPCCGTEFGYTDANRTHAELREAWVRGGMLWHSHVTPPPPEWSPLQQLTKFEHKVTASTVTSTKEEVAVIEMGERETVPPFNTGKAFNTGKVTVIGQLYGIGNIVRGWRLSTA